MAAMLIERFEVPGLAHYSYAIGCTKAGAIMVVDPERNIEGYLKFAADQKVQITHILETHIHADFASGGSPKFTVGQVFRVSSDPRRLTPFTHSMAGKLVSMIQIDERFIQQQNIERAFAS